MSVLREKQLEFSGLVNNNHKERTYAKISSPASDSERLKRQVSQTIILPLHFLIQAKSDCSSQGRERIIILVSCLQNYTIKLKEIAVLQRWSLDAKMCLCHPAESLQIVNTEKRHLDVLVRPESRNLDRMKRQHAQEITGYEDGVALLRIDIGFRSAAKRQPACGGRYNDRGIDTRFSRPSTWIQQKLALVPKAFVQYLAHIELLENAA
ncbi:uncharacterized protein F5891DRAFT_978738 [Suillus fuscotomentosus]|uniref:Uncharacterized protein n=1 Tax=Suillus fuscotomentosus TaxID=1912939 RepID=A0AAD4ECF9_9AGAM|nr:uncharacterized protein F5891DRAFT_978738 [Suillus fuscotomentosus]KAG1902434.1 hypothetical protein F5891DRAFT_978738 [Suillus fuscotomentosus]